MSKIILRYGIGIAILLLSSNNGFSQVPFQQKSKFSNMNAFVIRQRVKQGGTSRLIKELREKNFIDSQSEASKKTEGRFDKYNKKQKIEEEKIGTLDQFSSGLVMGDDMKNLFPTINGEILNYRLGLYSTKGRETDNDTIVRHYLPISIISKISGSNKNTTGTLNDATSFFGSPFTFRTTTIFLDRTTKNMENRFVVGMHNDLRIVTVGDTLTSKLETAFGYYGAIGFTYFGKGDVSNASDPSTKWEGTWSFSALAYFFSSGGTFNKAVFGNYEKKNLTGIELLLKFKTSSSEASKFNLLIGGNYGFTKGAPNFEKWSFRLGIGT